MTATERLRELLDERGVEWAEYGDGYTLLRHGGREYTVQPNVCNRLIVTNLTPEQAIAATLGTKHDRTEEWLLNACNQAAVDYIAELERKLEAATLGGGTLTAEKVRELMEDNSRQYPSPTDPYVWLTEYDWQAIADELNATLGSCNCSNDCTNSERTGTCHPIISDNLAESEGTGDAWAECSGCGHLLFVLTDPTSEPPNFCPNCGRKVVDE